MNLDRTITIYERQRNRNAYNELVETLAVKLENVPANVNYRGGREGMYARQVVATGNVVFTIRHYPGIDETMAVVFENKLYEVSHIEPVGRLQWLAIHATTSDNALPPVN